MAVLRLSGKYELRLEQGEEMSNRGRSNRNHATVATRRMRLLGVLLTVAAVAGACGSEPGIPGIDVAQGHAARPAFSAAAVAEAANEIDAFGLDLYRQTPAVDNAVMSPASVAVALAMARAGARDGTATQMDAVLHAFGSDSSANGASSLQQALDGLNGTFTDANGDKQDLTLRIANATFAQRGMALQPAYLDALSARFGAGIDLVDYQTNPEAARLLIDAWVSDRTEARIPDLLARGTIDETTRLALVNAAYLKAPWLNPFDPAATRDGAFTLADGSLVQVPTMHATLHEAAHAVGSDWQAVELPYAGNSLVMDLIVPTDVATFDPAFDAAKFTQIVGAFQTGEVVLALPKFKIESKTDLKDVLAKMGMPDAFDAAADFSGITAAEKLRISAVVHQANIDVDEKGTEATAATAALGSPAGIAPGPPLTLSLDRPFIFAVRDTGTGAVLFLGRVADPSR